VIKRYRSGVNIGQWVEAPSLTILSWDDSVVRGAEGTFSRSRNDHLNNDCPNMEEIRIIGLSE